MGSSDESDTTPQRVEIGYRCLWWIQPNSGDQV